MLSFGNISGDWKIKSIQSSEEILKKTLDVKTFFKISIGLKCRDPKAGLQFCSVLCVHYAILKINMLCNLCCLETRLRLLSNKYQQHGSLNLVSQQLKLCNIFIFGMVYWVPSGTNKAKRMKRFLWTENSMLYIILLVIAKARSAPLMMVVSIEDCDKHLYSFQLKAFITRSK